MTVTADRGTLSQDGEEVFLYDNVLLVREARRRARRNAACAPASCMWCAAQSVVRTDRDVVITEEDRVLSGRGMEYHNDTQELFLRERVRGRFEPKKKAKPEQ